MASFGIKSMGWYFGYPFVCWLNVLLVFCEAYLSYFSSAVWIQKVARLLQTGKSPTGPKGDVDESGRYTMKVGDRKLHEEKVKKVLKFQEGFIHFFLMNIQIPLWATCKSAAYVHSWVLGKLLTLFIVGFCTKDLNSASTPRGEELWWGIKNSDYLMNINQPKKPIGRYEH